MGRAVAGALVKQGAVVFICLFLAIVWDGHQFGGMNMQQGKFTAGELQGLKGVMEVLKEARAVAEKAEAEARRMHSYYLNKERKDEWDERWNDERQVEMLVSAIENGCRKNAAEGAIEEIAKLTGGLVA